MSAKPSTPPAAATTDPSFRRLWAAQSTSLVGWEITVLAIPLTAVIVLNASPIQMGLLGAVGGAPFLVFGLLAGVWVDRTRRQPLLVWSDVGRAALLLTIPASALAGVLAMPQLFVVAFLVGSLSLVSEVAHYAFVPSLLPRERIVDANSKLQVSHSAAGAAGPGIGGLIVEWLSAPLALVGSAGTLLASALLVRSIPARERLLRPHSSAAPLSEAWQGLSLLLGHPLLRSIAVPSVGITFSLGAVGSIAILYLVHELDLNPAVIGVIAAVGGLGAIPGALVSRLAADRVGVGATIIGGWGLWGLTGLALPLVTGPAWFVIGVLAAARVIGSLAFTCANVQQWSLRQVVTPDELQGRVTASHRFLVYGAEALGALAGGVVATALGLRPTLLLFSFALLIAILPALSSPLARLRAMPIKKATKSQPASAPGI